MRAVTGQTIRVLNAPAKDMECGVNAVLASVPAGDVLHLILTPDLTYVVADGVIQVVTPERAQDLEGRVQRIYDVMDLAAHPARADRLLVTLRALAAPETFGPGPAPADAPSLSFPDKGLLRVEAAPSVHARIEGALLAMRETPERQFHVQVWLASVADCARPVPAGGRGTDADEMNVLTRGRHALSCTTFEGRETRIEAAGARLTVRVYAADGRRLMVRAELVPEPGQTPVRAYIAIPDGEAYLVAADDPTGPKRVMAVRPTVLRPDVAMDGPPAPPAR
jgi:hypothetical protein